MIFFACCFVNSLVHFDVLFENIGQLLLTSDEKHHQYFKSRVQWLFPLTLYWCNIWLFTKQNYNHIVKMRHQMTIWSWIKNLQKTTHPYLKWYWFYRQQYFTRQIVVKYTIMIRPWSDLWYILYIIIKTGWMRSMELYLLAIYISEMTLNEFHEIRTCSYKNIRS